MGHEDSRRDGTESLKLVMRSQGGIEEPRTEQRGLGWGSKVQRATKGDIGDLRRAGRLRMGLRYPQKCKFVK